MIIIPYSDFVTKYPPLFRTIAYARVSTIDQTPENQIREIETVGFAIEPPKIIAKTVSGSRAIAQRKRFSRLLDQGIMTMNVIINAVAQFERDLLVRGKIRTRETVSAIARRSNTSRQTIMRVRGHT